MAEKMIKHLMFTYFAPAPNRVQIGGDDVLVERIARLGEVVDIEDEVSLQRGEELGSFFTDEERKAVEDGTYNGEDSEAVYRAVEGVRPVNPIQPVEGEGAQTEGMSTEDLGEYIRENRLNVEDTVALAKDGDEDSINKVYDAENIATDNDPRKGVTDALDKKLAALN